MEVKHKLGTVTLHAKNGEKLSDIFKYAAYPLWHKEVDTVIIIHDNKYKITKEK